MQSPAGLIQLLKGALDSVDTPLAIRGEDGALLFLNRAAKEMDPKPNTDLSARMCDVADEHGKRLGSVVLWPNAAARDAQVARTGEDAAREEHLRHAAEMERRIELLLDTTTEGIFGIDESRQCSFINGSAAAMLGGGREVFLGQDMHAVIHHHRWDDSPSAIKECPIHRAIHEGKGCHVEEDTFFRSDGSYFPVHYSCYPVLENGLLTGAIVTFSDISSRKRSDEALRMSEARFRGLFDHVVEGVYQTSASGELLATNRALVKMLGYRSEQELRALDVHDLYLNASDRDRLIQKLEREGHLVNEVLKLKRQDGGVIEVVENARTVYDSHRRIMYYEGTLLLKDGGIPQ